MKYKQSKKQNQRISQITEFTLVVGADIAKETHVARAIDFRGIELGKDCVFSNDQAGMEKLVSTGVQGLGRKSVTHHVSRVSDTSRDRVAWIFCDLIKVETRREASCGNKTSE